MFFQRNAVLINKVSALDILLHTTMLCQVENSRVAILSVVKGNKWASFLICDTGWHKEGHQTVKISASKKPHESWVHPATLIDGDKIG